MGKGDENGASALHYAALDGHDHVCNLLLECDAAVNARDNDGITPLLLAAENGQPSAIAALIAARADVNACDWERRNTPVLLACLNGHELSCSLLVAAGAEVERPN